MLKLLSEMSHVINSGEDLVMVTIIAGSGSTPRGTGARMLVGASGRICGTIGGGAVEYHSEKLAREALETKSSHIQSFSLSKNDVLDLGMICGGEVAVHFQHIAPSAELTALLGNILPILEQNLDIWMITDLSENGSFGFYTKEHGFFGIDTSAEFLPLMTRHPVKSTVGGREFYIEQISSSGLVYIFGGGHVAQELVPMLSHVGFRCVVLEDRPEFLTRELFPSAFDRVHVDFADISKDITVTENDYILIMTRGHSFDFTVQEQVLKMTPARYTGVIGSAKKAAAVNEKLRTAGVSDEAIGRIVTPIGLSIRAETPAEIAVSVTAQLIAARAGSLIR